MPIQQHNCCRRLFSQHCLCVKLHARLVKGLLVTEWLVNSAGTMNLGIPSNLMVTCCCDARRLLGSAVLVLLQNC